MERKGKEEKMKVREEGTDERKMNGEKKGKNERKKERKKERKEG